MAGAAAAVVGAGVAVKAAKVAVTAVKASRATKAAASAQKAARAVVKGCKHSFAPDTPVLKADGTTTPIADVEIGDSVLATDPETGVTQERLVSALFVHDDDNLLDIVVGTPSGAETIKTTRSHSFWVESAHTWVEAEYLRQGDILRRADGDSVPVEQVVARLGRATMYDLTVDITHTFYVMAGQATPVLVHNCDVSHIQAIGKVAHGRAEAMLGRFFPTSQIKSNVMIRTPFGRRFADLAVTDSRGRIRQLFEIKANGSRYTASQRLKDAYIAVRFRVPTTVLRFTVRCPVCR